MARPLGSRPHEAPNSPRAVVFFRPGYVKTANELPEKAVARDAEGAAESDAGALEEMRGRPESLREPNQSALGGRKGPAATGAGRCFSLRTKGLKKDGAGRGGELRGVEPEPDGFADEVHVLVRIVRLVQKTVRPTSVRAAHLLAVGG